MCEKSIGRCSRVSTRLIPCRANNNPMRRESLGGLTSTKGGEGEGGGARGYFYRFVEKRSVGEQLSRLCTREENFLVEEIPRVYR